MNYVKITMIVLVSFGVCNIQASAAAGTASVGGKVAYRLDLSGEIMDALYEGDLQTVTHFFDTHDPAYLEASSPYDYKSKTSLMIAADPSGGGVLSRDINPSRKEIFNELLRRKANVNAIDREGNSVLYHVIQGRDLDILCQLLNAKVDINSNIDDRDNTALHQAVNITEITANDIEIIKLLLQKGASVNALNFDNITPLWQLLINEISPLERQLEAARILVQHGASPFIGSYNDQTLLEFLEDQARRAPRPDYQAKIKFLKEVIAAFEMKKVLVEKVIPEMGRTVEEYMIGPRTPAKKAPEVKKEPEVAPASTAKAAEKLPNIFDAIAGKEGKEIATYLAMEGPVNILNAAGQTPLIVAAQQGDVYAVQSLLRAKADASRVDNDHNTALIVATKGGHVEVVRLLLGAMQKDEVIMRNSAHDSAYMIAKRNYDKNLKAAGAVEQKMRDAKSDEAKRLFSSGLGKIEASEKVWHDLVSLLAPYEVGR